VDSPLRSLPDPLLYFGMLLGIDKVKYHSPDSLSFMLQSKDLAHRLIQVNDLAESMHNDPVRRRRQKAAESFLALLELLYRLTLLGDIVAGPKIPDKLIL
jgi:hypothetical protein